jgi:hypothetical protein
MKKEGSLPCSQERAKSLQTKIIDVTKINILSFNPLYDEPILGNNFKVYLVVWNA